MVNKSDIANHNKYSLSWLESLLTSIVSMGWMIPSRRSNFDLLQLNSGPLDTPERHRCRRGGRQETDQIDRFYQLSKKTLFAPLLLARVQASSDL